LYNNLIEIALRYGRSLEFLQSCQLTAQTWINLIANDASLGTRDAAVELDVPVTDEQLASLNH